MFLFFYDGGPQRSAEGGKWAMALKRLRTTALKPIENLELLIVLDSRVSYFFRLVRIECN